MTSIKSSELHVKMQARTLQEKASYRLYLARVVTTLVNYSDLVKQDFFNAK